MIGGPGARRREHDHCNRADHRDRGHRNPDRRTAANRPDLIRRLAATGDGLDKRDRQVIAEAGFPVDGESMAH